MASVGSKLLSNMILSRLIDAVGKVLRKGQCSSRKYRGFIDHNFTLSLMIEKCLSYQIPLILSPVDYEQAFDSVDRKASAKVLSLYGIQTNTLK